MNRKYGLHRLQFSVRSILAIISLAAIGCTYLLRQDAARRQLITDIEDAGGTVKYDESISLTLFKSQRVAEVMLPHGRLSELNPLRLKSLPNLATLALKDVDLTNNDGARLQCSELRLTRITDDTLKHLGSQSTHNEKR